MRDSSFLTVNSRQRKGAYNNRRREQVFVKKSKRLLVGRAENGEEIKGKQRRRKETKVKK